jgi:hypothetical protein
MESKFCVDVIFWTTLWGYLDNTLGLLGQNTMGLPEQFNTGEWKVSFMWMSYSGQHYGVTWTTLWGYLDKTLWGYLFHVDDRFWTTLWGYVDNTMEIPEQHYGVTWTALWGYLNNTMGLPEQLRQVD